MAVVTLLNQKGGVGKTSTCHHLGGALAQLGRRVLLIDNDPQSSLTQGLWGPPAMRALDPSETLAAVYRGEEPFPEQVIRPSGIDGVDLVAGSRVINGWNLPFPESVPVETQLLLRSFLEPVRTSYDWVLIDCPPNLNLCSWTSLAASDGLVVPLQPEDYGAQGVVEVEESVGMIRSGPNPGLALYGFLLTMVSPRRSIHKLYEETLRGLYGPGVFSTVVPHAADYPEAIASRKPIGHYKPKSAAAKVMKALAAELEERASAERTVLTTEAA